jgi:hypothetical protein
VDSTRRTASLTGWLFIVTFVASISAFFIFYAPVRDNPNYITGAGADPTTSVALGALLELIVIIANVGTAVVLFPILKRQSEAGAIGYVSARLAECMFIAIGIISLLAFLLMRQEATAGTDAALGQVFIAIYDRAFLIGPGFFAGLANGLILGYLMYRSRLVPRWMAMLGLIGGPLINPLGDRHHVRRLRARFHASGHRDDPGVHLGTVPRHLPHRQGIQAVSDPFRQRGSCGVGKRDPPLYYEVSWGARPLCWQEASETRSGARAAAVLTATPARSAPFAPRRRRRPR